jgi:hypothetical protein
MSVGLNPAPFWCKNYLTRNSVVPGYRVILFWINSSSAASCPGPVHMDQAHDAGIEGTPKPPKGSLGALNW